MNVKAYNTFKTKLSIGLKNYPFKKFQMLCRVKLDSITKED